MIKPDRCVVLILLAACVRNGNQAVAQEQCAVSQLLGVDGELGGAFGYDVAASNDVIVVCGNGTAGPYDGETSVFRFDGIHWVFEQKLEPSGKGLGFGVAVAIDGDLAVVGGDESGDENAVHVFRRDSVSWKHEQKLVSPGGGGFGGAVAVDDDWMLVGARSDDEAGQDAGALYTFRFDGEHWVQMQKIIPDDTNAFDYFGDSVAMSGDAAVVGALLSDTNGLNAGTAYILRRKDNSWSIETEIYGPPGDGLFPWSVSTDGDVLVLGHRYDNHAGAFSGAAFVYRYDKSVWNLEQTLTASDASAQDFFGESVSIRGSTIAVGANGDGNPDDGLVIGSGYTFEHDGQTWVETQVLVPPEGEENEWFGTSIAVGKGSVLVGAPGDTDNCWSGGAVYVFGPPGPDCNQNGISDLCEIGDGLVADVNNNSIPDDCDPTPGDIDADGTVGPFDLAQMLAAWGICEPSPGPGCCPQNLTGDFHVDADDLAILLANWQ